VSFGALGSSFPKQHCRKIPSVWNQGRPSRSGGWRKLWLMIPEVGLPVRGLGGQHDTCSVRRGQAGGKPFASRGLFPDGVPLISGWSPGHLWALRPPSLPSGVDDNAEHMLFFAVAELLQL